MRLAILILTAAIVTSCVEPIGCSCHDDLIIKVSTEKKYVHYNSYLDVYDTTYTYDIVKGFGGRYDIMYKEGFYYGKERLSKVDTVLEGYGDLDLQTLNFNQTVYCP